MYEAFMKLSAAYNRKIWLKLKRAILPACAYGLLFAAAYSAYGYVKEAGREKYYTIVANIKKTDELKAGAPVLMSGINVGVIAGMELEPDFSVNVRMNIRKGVAIPDDSAAAVYTDGLLGAKYIAILPGGSEDAMRDGDDFAYTQDSVNITEMIELGIRNFSESKDKK
jgi:phospholipid/cholesterol/gamma-HCH transport system substrate-binding protein